MIYCSLSHCTNNLMDSRLYNPLQIFLFFHPFMGISNLSLILHLVFSLHIHIKIIECQLEQLCYLPFLILCVSLWPWRNKKSLSHYSFNEVCSLHIQWEDGICRELLTSKYIILAILKINFLTGNKLCWSWLQF